MLCIDAQLPVPSVSVAARLRNEDGQSQEQEATSPEQCDPVPPKKRRVGGFRPHKTVACVRNFKPCTYCGMNIPDSLQKGEKENMKRHWALKHAIELCKEMGAEVDDEENPVPAKSFIEHLDKVDHVYNSLHTHNYKIVPACNFFDIM